MTLSGYVNTYWSRHISTSYPLNWSIEEIKGFALDDLCTDFTTYTESGETTLDDEETAQRN